ncbi:MAG: 3-methyl-2-oxobutanoate hydroxymethyltransferase, partial [Lentisphaeria bacterium]
TTYRLLKMKQAGEKKITALAVYDYTTAKLADESGLDILLVGDSLGMTMLGYSSTVPVTLEQSLHHTAAVARGAERALVIGDMPFMTYQVSTEKALENAGRYLQEARAHGVKLEGGETIAPLVERLVKVGIPVLGHIGIQPQSILAEGRYRVRGRTDNESEELIRDAFALQNAGAFAVVLEGITSELGKRISEELTIPTIGIGAGVWCDGQIQVVHDLLGLSEDRTPKHAKPYAQLGELTREAFASYIKEVESGAFPAEQHSFE